MTLQILNGTIDPNWVVAVILLVTSFLLGRMLNRFEKKQDSHDDKLANHETRITVIEKRDEL